MSKPIIAAAMFVAVLIAALVLGGCHA